MLNRDIHHAGVLQVLLGQPGQIGIDFQRRHLLRPMSQQRRHIARSGTDLEHPLVLANIEILQQPGLDPRRQHVLQLRAGARRQRDLGIHECHRLVGRRDEILASNHRQQREHGRIEHLPRADLLLDHVETGLFGIHRWASR